MDGLFVAYVSAFWLGIMTSISPCPLATNVAAISFLSKRIAHPYAVLSAGTAYTAGRMLSYAVLGFFLVNSLLSVPDVARFLQRYLSRALGPILIFTGLVLLEAVRIRLPGVALSERRRNRLGEAGVPGAFLLGLFFALAFCPVSAALFFGGLVPLALRHNSSVMLPLVYGIGTGLPVLVFAFMMAVGVKSLSRWFNRITKIEFYMRKIAGIVFVGAGIYYTMAYFIKTGGS